MPRTAPCGTLHLANLSRRILTERTIEPIETGPSRAGGGYFDYKGLPFLEPGFGTLRACTSHTDVCVHGVVHRMSVADYEQLLLTKVAVVARMFQLPRCTCSLHLVRASD